MRRIATISTVVALIALLAVVLSTGSAFSQAAARRVTTIAALRQFPSYFHLQNVLVHGELVESGSRVLLRGGESEVPVILNDAKTTSGLMEVRGQLIDVGRLEPGDPRVRGYSEAPEPEHWPRPGEELVLNVTSVADTQLATMPSVRALALQPWRFEGQKVTITGEFRGRNLFGDLPNAPGKSRYDFVLRSADSAVWVTDIRPRGRGFDLSVEARVDTGRWLQISGTVSQERGLVAISGATLVAATPPQELPTEEAAAPAPPPEPGEVVFSSPTEGEIDVPASGSVRIQFSRGLDAASLTDRIRVSYFGAAQQAAAPELLEFTTSYDLATRAVEIRFMKPPERFRTIRVEVLEGVKTFDGAPIRAWTLTFSVGG
jgi:Big-like domain-containing protein